MAHFLENLESFGLSPISGFVPPKASSRLPPHYHIWEDVVGNLGEELKADSLSQTVSLLPLLEVKHLEHEQDWQRAYVLLAFLVHALVHGCGHKDVPPCLAEPFLKVSKHLGMEPVVSYAGLCLYNWQHGGTLSELSGLKTVASFTDTIDEDAFYLVPVLVELEGGRLPVQLLEAHIAAGEQRWNELAGYLTKCIETLGKMIDALKLLKFCDPTTFYNTIRPFIAGLDVKFELRDAPPIPFKAIGGSAVQSALFPFIDHMLGVKHESSILKEMRAYTPGNHRRFLELVAALPSIPELTIANGAPEGIFKLLEGCQLQLKVWRDKHIAVVTRYILLPAQAAARQQKSATASVSGTAGSSPVGFLKEMRDDSIPRHNK